MRIDDLPPLTPDPVIEAYKANFDRATLRENLRRTVPERLQRLVDLQRLAHEARGAVRRARERG